MPRNPRQPGRPKHDASYKSLFASPRTVADTLRHVLRELATRLDFSTLERLPASFVTEHLGQRHADMLWRIRMAGGGWLYLLVLLEFQSTSATFSPRRRSDWLDTFPGIGIFSLSCRRSMLRCCRPETRCR